jgi:hypothetical protein
MVMSGLAWACTNFLRVESLNPATTRALTKATAQGTGAPAGAAVELRWNTVTGPPLATVKADTAGAFAAEVQVPNVPAGVYVLVAKVDEFVARTPIEVQSNPGDANVGYAEAPQSSSGGRAVGGTVLLALGLVVLAGGALAVSSRRKQATAKRAASSVDRFEQLV